MRDHIVKLPPKTRIILAIPLVLLAYPLVMNVLPAIIRAMVPDVVRSVLSLL